MYKLKFYLLSLVIIKFCISPLTVYSNDASLMEMDLEDLMSQRAEMHRSSKTASGVAESVMDAPAALVVVTKEDIKKRGYLSIDEVIQDLPGFDTIVTNGTMQVVSYQRGYRTPWTQRTLLLINGKVDNNLWNQSAQLSRQYPITGIERIEVLYGPAGAVYGTNAFLGVINIITKDPRSLKEGESYLRTQVQVGDFETIGVDLTAGGSLAGLNYQISARTFTSEEAGIEDYSEWIFTNPALLSDVDNWGPAIANSDFNNDGTTDSFNGYPLGQYSDPTDDYGIMGEIGSDNWKAGFIKWQTNEAYGPYYAFDKGQPGTNWIHASTQYYVDYSLPYNDKLNIDTELLYRDSRVGGQWVESAGGSVSISEWNSYNTAWRFRQQYQYTMSDGLQISGGIKLERKSLTKAYFICGYWGGSICPNDDGFTDGSDAQPITDDPATPEDERITIPLPSEIEPDAIPSYNLVNTTDKGAFVQAIYDVNKWRFNGGFRWDENSIYGSVINPRGAAIYKWTPKTTVKFVFGKAFQEPAPKELYGGWSGRQANPDLEPEITQNMEFIFIHQSKNILHDVSLYSASYKDVIAGSQNIGERDIMGLEYRMQFDMGNPIYKNEDITGRLFYTYTDATAEQQYDNVAGVWVDQSAEMGDIAPHKIVLLLNMPLASHWNANFQVNWVSDRKLFSQNPLRADSNAARAEDREVAAYTTVDLNLMYDMGNFVAGLKINNLLEEDYYHPGVESASSGDSGAFSAGYQNSLLPQVNTRVFQAYTRFEF